MGYWRNTPTCTRCNESIIATTFQFAGGPKTTGAAPSPSAECWAGGASMRGKPFSNKKPRTSLDGGVFLEASKPYGAYVSNNSLGTLKSRDIMTLNAVMVKIENTNSLRAQTVSSTAL